MTNAMTKTLFRSAMLAVATALTVRSAAAQDKPTESEAEKSARLARRGAGVTAGTWSLSSPGSVAGVKSSNSVIVDGFFRKGLDRHLVLENSISVFKRTQVDASNNKTESWIVPQYTSLRMYPVSEPGDSFEPWISGGAGITLGFDDRTPGKAQLFGSSTNGLQIVPGFGLKGGAGIEWRFSKAFGLIAGGRYQWIKFFSDFGGARTYAGVVLEAGVSYRFQY